MGCRKKRFRATRIGADWSISQRAKALTKAGRKADRDPVRRISEEATAFLASRRSHTLQRTPA